MEYILAMAALVIGLLAFCLTGSRPGSSGA